MRLLDPLLEARSITMEAHPRRLQDAREWAGDVAGDAGLSDSDCFQVRLAMSEAVANAVQHGSRGESDSIRIAACERDGSLVFEVRDSGRFVAPRSHSTLEDESGRGLEVLAMVTDHVEMTSVGGGSVLRFSKRLPVASRRESPRGDAARREP